MSKVAPGDDAPDEETRDAFTVDGPTVGAATTGDAVAPKPPRTIDRAKMNIRRGSKRVIQLFDTKPDEMQLDIDNFYKARIRRRTHFHEEITGNLARGGVEVSDVDAASPSQSRGIMMTLSPGEEYENYQKVNLATNFQQASLLSDDPGEDSDIPEEDEENASEAESDRTRSRRADRRTSVSTKGSRTATGTFKAAVDPASAIDLSTAAAARPLILNKKPQHVDLTNVNSPTLHKLIKRNTFRSQAKAFARSKKMINPHGRIRLVWDLLSIIFILYNAFVLPFRASFDPTQSGADDFDTFVDIFFMVDILVMFNTAIEVDGSVVYSRRAAFKFYVTGWFIVDIIAAIPYDSILPADAASSTSTLRRTLKLLRLIRLLRLFRISRIFRRIQNAIFIRSTLTALFKYVLMVMFVSHWFSCIFHGIATTHMTGKTWVTVNKLQDPYGDKWDRYIAALYFAVMTLATIGFGDVAGTNADERLFSIFAMIVGGGIFAYGITNIVELVSSLTISETRFRTKMDEVNEYMAARDLPMKVRMEIREFYHNTRQSRESKLNGEQHILGELSSKLRSKIALSINDQFLRKFPFFIGSEPNFLMELALNMRMIHFAPLEDVLIEGEIGHEMFFIFRGAVEVLRAGQQIGILGENQYFGEMAILSPDNRRRATVRTLCFCELRMLSRNRFLDALALFPVMQAKMAQVARSRQAPPPQKQSSTGKESPKKGDAPATTVAGRAKQSLSGTLAAIIPRKISGSKAPPPVPTGPTPPPEHLLPPPDFVDQKPPPILSVGDIAASASARLRISEHRKSSGGFTPVVATTAARLNNVVRRSSLSQTPGNISSSMALALSDVAAKLEEATRRQEMLVAVISKMQAELEHLQVPSV